MLIQYLSNASFTTFYSGIKLVTRRKSCDSDLDTRNCEPDTRDSKSDTRDTDLDTRETA